MNSQPTARRSLQASAFAGLLIAYWILVYAAPLTLKVSRGSIVYAMLIGPVLLFVLLGSTSLMRRRWMPARVVLLVAYIVIVCGIAITRGDLPTITSTLLTMVLITLLTTFRLAPPGNLLNLLFLASIPLNLAMHHAGLSIYSVVPGLSADEDLPWRVSIFPVVAESAFFSAVILVINVLKRNLVQRRLCLALSIYFLVLSGLRSALVGAALALFYYFVVHKMWSWRPSVKMLYVGLVCVLFVGSLLTTQLLAISSILSNEYLNVYLFRAEGGIDDEVQLTKAIYRGWIWSEHLRLAMEHPVLGIGTFDFAEKADFEEVEGRPSSGSESFLTALYARVGLAAALFAAFLIASIWRGVKAGQHEQLMIGLLLIVAMLAYGSFLVAYNFVFLVMIAFVCVVNPMAVPGSRADSPRVLPEAAKSHVLLR